ncbi:uncharacterized protein LOC125673142 [Ostrea edulis]|uniref:uncharacterized protein LOC125673142 n=1 Tax=Ostrea edulis TaxID=37623 RepID=UPI0020962682|nr:uncharacterized protein LOC125673142 [Ostrea edulis]
MVKETAAVLILGLLCVKYGLAQSPHVCAHADMCTTDSQCGKGRTCLDYGDHKCCSDSNQSSGTKSEPPTGTPSPHVCDPADVCTKTTNCGSGRTCVDYGDHSCCTATKPSHSKVHVCPHKDMCSTNGDCRGHGRWCKRYSDHGCCTGGHGGH